jgi:hypothetical protein
MNVFELVIMCGSGSYKKMHPPERVHRANDGYGLST